MDKSLYEKLTDDEKLGLLHYIRGSHGLVEHWHYESLVNNPRLPVNPEYVYVSSVLGIDFEHFYSNSGWDNGRKFEKEMKEVKLFMG